MADRREDILARLLAIVSGLDGFTTAARNKANVSDLALPAVILFDGDEEVDARGAKPSSGPARQLVVNMSPTIRVEIDGTPETIGTTANAHRAVIIDTITADATLLALLFNEELSYDGSQMALLKGRDHIYQMDVDFTFTYVMRPGALAA